MKKTHPTKPPTSVTHSWCLTTPPGDDKTCENSGVNEYSPYSTLNPDFMSAINSDQPPEKRNSMGQCKHPRVQIVAREEDAEFVECLECREIFESSEFRDMAIEDTSLANEL